MAVEMHITLLKHMDFITQQFMCSRRFKMSDFQRFSFKTIDEWQMSESSFNLKQIPFRIKCFLPQFTVEQLIQIQKDGEFYFLPSESLAQEAGAAYYNESI